MHFVMRQYQVDPAAVAAIAPRIRETMTHYFSQVLPGFVEYCLIDAGNGCLIALGIFEDQAVAEAAAQVAAGYVRDHLAAVVPDIPQAKEGTVLVRLMGHTPQPETSS